MGRVIGLAGRLGSGKTELARICEEKGYTRLYFALPLKQLVADLIGVGLDDINGLKNVEKDYDFGDKEYEIISVRTSIPLDNVREEMSKHKFKTVRQLLQVIGTDLIRENNKDWHVNEIRKMVQKDRDYVFDDVRFPNELALIMELGGICWYIVRPKLDNVSNHISETSIRWQDCGTYVIINDGDLNTFTSRWEAFVKDYYSSLRQREKYLRMGETKCMGDLEISEHMASYVKRDFGSEKIKEIVFHSADNVEVVYDNDKRITVSNPLNIEDLKFFVKT